MRETPRYSGNSWDLDRKLPILFNPRQITDPFRFEHLINMSQGVDLFYKKENSASLNVLSKNTESANSRQKVSFPGYESSEIMDILHNPSQSLEKIEQRRQVFDALLDVHTDISSLKENLQGGYRLADDFKSLSQVSSAEESRIENLRERGEDVTPRTDMEILFGKSISYLRVKEGIDALENTENLNYQEWERIQDITGWENISNDGEEIWERIHIWRRLHSLHSLKERIQTFLEIFGDIPEANIQKMTRVLKDEFHLLPNVSAKKIYLLWKQGKEEELGKIKSALEEMELSLRKVGALLTLAKHFQEEEFGRAEFDSEKPESFGNGWNFLYEKQDKSWDEEIIWEQIQNNSPEHTPITLLSGPNMSGKSFYLEQVLHTHLCAQSFGYVPAQNANFHLYDAFIFLDRSNTDSDNNLSAFGKEIANWKEVFRSGDNEEKKMILADESYSTTSPRDQLLLGLATMEHVVENNGRLYFSNHNNALLDIAESSPDVRIYHFETGIGKTGDIDFLHRIQPGIENSKALSVARRLKLPLDIITDAKSYIEENFSRIQPSEHISTLTQMYSPEKREQLKAKSIGFIDFSERGNEVVILPFDEYPHKGKGEISEYSGDSFLGFKYKLFQSYMGDESIPNLCETKSHERGGLEKFYRAYTDDWELQFGNTGQLSEIVRMGPPHSPEEVIERQNLFECLADCSFDFAGFADKHSSQTRGILTFLPGYYDWGEKVPGFGFKNFFHIALQKLQKARRDDHANSIPFRITFLKGLINLFHKSFDEELYNNKLNLLEEIHSSRIQSRFGITKYPFFPQEKVNDLFGTQENSDDLFQQESRLKSALEQIEDEVLLQLPEYDLSEYEHKDIAPIFSEALDVLWKELRKNQINGDCWHVGTALAALFAEPASGKDMCDSLRKYDSVHLHQWANYFEQIANHIAKRIPAGKNLFEKLKEYETDEERFKYIESLAPTYYGRLLSQEVGEIKDIKKVADWMRKEKFCKVSFSDESSMKIVQGWNPGLNRMGKKKQIHNDSIHDSQHRINLITGTNMSGKTFNLKQNISALLCAQTVGMAPAQSMITPFFDGIVYLDRVHSQQKEGLSAFGNEIDIWKSLLKRIHDGELLFLVADEAFSTTQPSDQAALSYAVSKYIAEKGGMLTLSSHNHEFINTLLKTNPDITKAWHFHTDIHENGKMGFNYQKEEGHAPSQAIDVARHLGMNENIIKKAMSLNERIE